MATIATHPAVPATGGGRLTGSARTCLCNFVLGILLIAAGTLPSYAAPPSNANPELAPWFHGLKQPDNGVGCCSVADCRGVAYREAGESVEVFVDEKTYGPGAPNAWVLVPPEKILQRQENKTGNAIACWHPGTGVMCFIFPPQA